MNSRRDQKRQEKGERWKERGGSKRERRDHSVSSTSRSGNTDTLCVSLNSKEVIMSPSYMVIPEELLGVVMMESVSNVVSLTVQLELKSRLANGSSLLITSQKVDIMCSMVHPTNSSGKTPIVVRAYPREGTVNSL